MRWRSRNTRLQSVRLSRLGQFTAGYMRDPLRTADSMCWREIREIIVKNTPERVRCRHDSLFRPAPRKRPHLGFCRPDESPVEPKKSIRAVARARRNDTDPVDGVTRVGGIHYLARVSRSNEVPRAKLMKRRRAVAGTKARACG